MKHIQPITLVLENFYCPFGCCRKDFMEFGVCHSSVCGFLPPPETEHPKRYKLHAKKITVTGLKRDYEKELVGKQGAIC